MKKNFLFPCLALLLILGSRSSCQENSSTIGFHFAPTINSYWENESVIENSNMGISAGVGFNIILRKKLSILTGLEYEQKGVKYKSIVDIYPPPTIERKIISNFHYLTIPLLLSYKTNGKTVFHFELGSYFSYLLQDRFKIYFDDKLVADLKNNPDQNKIDSGIAMGVGVLFPIGDKAAFDLGFRDRLGLVHKINSFGLNLGFKFNL